MRWEQLPKDGGFGPGKRWGHTCNGIKGGKLLYVFGGFGKANCQTNQVHVFDTVNRTWSEPVMKGVAPKPRDSHSCTTVGDNLFVFGGTDGRNPLRDLFILDTSSNTWISPSVRGDGPEAREGHSAALIGKRLFIFGGCGKYENSEVYYDDLYILNTETFFWKRVVPSGTPPSKRDSHTCTSWKNKIIVIGGEDSCNYYLSDVHILDTDTLVWCKLNTTGQLLPPRAGHTTVALGKYMFVFGGFSDEQSLYDDVYMLDIENGSWTKVMATGEGPSARFSMAGESLNPHMGGVLIFIGGCNKNLEALDDMYFLYTGLATDHERDDRRIEKLSLRKQLKLKCQEQNPHAPLYDIAPVRVENNANIHQPVPISTYFEPGSNVISGRPRVNLHEYHTPLGKKTFEATVMKNFGDGYTIETIIDGKPLRGLLFSNKPLVNKETLDDSIRKMETVEINGANMNNVQNNKLDITRRMEQNVEDARLVHDVPVENAIAPDSQFEEGAAAQMKNPVPSAASMHPLEASSKPAVAHDANLESNGTNNVPHSGNEISEENEAKECVT